MQNFNTIFWLYFELNNFNNIEKHLHHQVF